MDPHVRFAIVGCGMISAFHAGAIAAIEDAALAGVYDAVPELAEKAAGRYGVKRYATLEALAADPAVDAVCICTPSGLHAGQALEMVRAGKHVLVEKPIALTLEECDAIIALAAEKGVQAGAVSQCRFSPQVAAVRQALAEGRLGRLVGADLYMKFYRPQSYYDNGGWRGTLAMDGGGALMNQGIHGVDLMRWLVGPAASVAAVGGTYVRDIEVEDTVNALVEYRCGAVGVIQATTAAYPGFPRRIELNGEYGCIVMEEERVTRWEVEGCPYYANREVLDLADGGGAGEQEAQNKDGGGHSDPTGIDPQRHVLQLKNFIAAIRGDEPLLVDAAEGRATLAMVLGTYEAMAGRQTVYFGPAGHGARAAWL